MAKIQKRRISKNKKDLGDLESKIRDSKIIAEFDNITDETKISAFRNYLREKYDIRADDLRRMLMKKTGKTQRELFYEKYDPLCMEKARKYGGVLRSPSGKRVWRKEYKSNNQKWPYARGRIINKKKKINLKQGFKYL